MTDQYVVGHPKRRENGCPPPGITEEPPLFLVRSGIGQKLRDMKRPPDMAEDELRPRFTPSPNINLPPFITLSRRFGAETSRIPNWPETGPPACVPRGAIVRNRG